MTTRDTTCPWCEGAGQVRRRGHGTTGDYGEWLVVCHRCAGTGRASLFTPLAPGPAVQAASGAARPAPPEEWDDDPPDLAA
jgi:hypothetical protein